MKVGMNLFSLMNFVQTEEGFIETAKKLKELGCDVLQYSGAPYHPEWAIRELKEIGLPFVLTHVNFDYLESDLEKAIEEHLSFGCRNIGIGGYDWEMFTSDEKMKALVNRLETIGEKIADKGLKFFYHNHRHEFIKMGSGQSFYYYLIENAPHVNLTLDTRWVAEACEDLAGVIDKAKGRLECVHIRDSKIYLKRNQENMVDFETGDCAIGSGNLCFKKWIPMLKQAGAEQFIIEDTAFRRPNTWDEIAFGIRYLKENF